MMTSFDWIGEFQTVVKNLRLKLDRQNEYNPDIT